MSSRIPGPLGSESNNLGIDKGTLALTNSPVPRPVGTKLLLMQETLLLNIDDNSRILAATVYGEASVKSVREEMYAIANVLVRQQNARGYTDIKTFITTDKTFAFAAHDGNSRYKALMEADDEMITSKNIAMADALFAANNAISKAPVDYSNGAYFWDGADIKTNYDNHVKVLAGIHFSKPEHNIYGIEEKEVPGEVWWKDAKGNKTKKRGSWKYKYISTAAYGGTIFWKYSEDFLKASGNKDYN